MCTWFHEMVIELNPGLLSGIECQCDTVHAWQHPSLFWALYLLFVFGLWTLVHSCHQGTSGAFCNADDLLMWIPARQKGKCLCFQVFPASWVATAVMLSAFQPNRPPKSGCNTISASVPPADAPRYPLLFWRMRAYLLTRLPAQKPSLSLESQPENNNCRNRI